MVKLQSMNILNWVPHSYIPEFITYNYTLLLLALVHLFLPHHLPRPRNIQFSYPDHQSAHNPLDEHEVY